MNSSPISFFQTKITPIFKNVVSKEANNQRFEFCCKSIEEYFKEYYAITNINQRQIFQEHCIKFIIDKEYRKNCLNNNASKSFLPKYNINTFLDELCTNRQTYSFVTRSSMKFLCVVLLQRHNEKVPNGGITSLSEKDNFELLINTELAPLFKNNQSIIKGILDYHSYVIDLEYNTEYNEYNIPNNSPETKFFNTPTKNKKISYLSYIDNILLKEYENTLLEQRFLDHVVPLYNETVSVEEKLINIRETFKFIRNLFLYSNSLVKIDEEQIYCLFLTFLGAVFKNLEHKSIANNLMKYISSLIDLAQNKSGYLSLINVEMFIEEDLMTFSKVNSELITESRLEIINARLITFIKYIYGTNNRISENVKNAVINNILYSIDKLPDHFSQTVRNGWKNIILNAQSEIWRK